MKISVKRKQVKNAFQTGSIMIERKEGIPGCQWARVNASLLGPGLRSSSGTTIP